MLFEFWRKEVSAIIQGVYPRGPKLRGCKLRGPKREMAGWSI